MTILALLALSGCAIVNRSDRLAFNLGVSTGIPSLPSLDVGFEMGRTFPPERNDEENDDLPGVLADLLLGPELDQLRDAQGQGEDGSD